VSAIEIVPLETTVFISTAQEIGFLYRKAKEATAEAMRYYLACGERLLEQKRGLSHGKWLPWLEANRCELGFAEATAQRLMQAASNPALTRDLTGDNLTVHVEQETDGRYIAEVPSVPGAIAYGETREEAEVKAKAIAVEERAIEVSREIWGNAKPHLANNSGENEWYTPSQYIEAARVVMGGIDLDPASNDIAQETVKAESYFTIQDDGLTNQWHGRIWLNPPYSKDLLYPFIDKLLTELEAGRVTEAIVLTNNATDTAWFHRAEELARLICFTRGRIDFLTPSGDGGAPLQGQAFFYFGDNESEFRSRFSDFGFVR
jgi:phage N-6-adenine-methyltransferase